MLETTAVPVVCLAHFQPVAHVVHAPAVTNNDVHVRCVYIMFSFSILAQGHVRLSKLGLTTAIGGYDDTVEASTGARRMGGHNRLWVGSRCLFWEVFGRRTYYFSWIEPFAVRIVVPRDSKRSAHPSPAFTCHPSSLPPPWGELCHRSQMVKGTKARR